MNENDWNCALKRVNDSTSCVRPSVIQFKILHQIHFSKATLAKLFPNSNASCGRCHNTPPNLTYMFWSCPALTTYWSMIFKSLSNALVINFKSNATTATFGITVGEYSIYRESHKSIIAFATLLTHRRILLHWKSKHTP